MEQTIIMNQGASKVTSRQENFMKEADRFFHDTAKKLSWQTKKHCLGNNSNESVIELSP